MVHQDSIILYFVIIAMFIFMGLVSLSPTGYEGTSEGYCGDKICQPELGENPITCPEDCSGPAVTCGNGICDPGETPITCPEDCSGNFTVCGDKICQSPEDCESCPLDCGYCQGGGNGQNQTTNDTMIIIEPPKDPTEFPPEIPMPEPGETVELPSEGASVSLEPGVTLGLFPLKNFNATIYNLTKISAGSFKLLLCNQTSVTSWEINVSADLAYLCVDYSKYNIEEPTLSVYKFENGTWVVLPPSKIILNMEKKIICGNIASTPYLISGFSQTTSSRVALEAILEANRSIYDAKGKGFNVSQSLDMLDFAWSAYYVCEFTLAKSLADKSKEMLVSIPFYVIIAVATIVAIVWYNYYRVKMRVRIKKRK